MLYTRSARRLTFEPFTSPQREPWPPDPKHSRSTAGDTHVFYFSRVVVVRGGIRIFVVGSLLARGIAQAPDRLRFLFPPGARDDVRDLRGPKYELALAFVRLRLRPSAGPSVIDYSGSCTDSSHGTHGPDGQERQQVLV